ncbi:sugar-binding transcriptional regulator [Glaciihabitans arcticus]|uniref:Sugar-binding transcriptional regulator n=1 Tax=Glaciihabitans arcticus TaxID=2668039 RepID=A0A4Q9GUX5_9MICO|nr:sugar-binding transcriptional regulator [Glaciihabitans arcticus]TBN56383.1 sugar-binding transcriptional regulator [Glaciihabitans arcticus]
MTDELTIVRVAELYYDENKTQDEIGALLKITRWKVGRLLTQARAEGIVRIEIVHPRARRLGIERDLRERFGLVDAIVVPTLADDSDVQSRVAQAAADYLTALRPVPRTLGISWGRTLSEIADKLEPGWAHGITVVQINGGVTLNRRAGTAATTAVEIARKAEGQAILLPSPAILERVETKAAIEADRTVAGVLEMATTASAYVYSAGVVDQSSVLVDSGYLDADGVAELTRKGAVGDVVGRYIDANGNIVDPGLNDRTVGLGLDRLKNAELAIFVVAGSAKHDVARAVVTSGLCSVIVTDEATANDLIKENS